MLEPTRIFEGSRVRVTNTFLTIPVCRGEIGTIIRIYDCPLLKSKRIVVEFDNKSLHLHTGKPPLKTLDSNWDHWVEHLEAV